MTSLTARTVILRVEQAVNITASSKTANPNKNACRLGRDGGPLCLGIAPFASVPVLCIRKRRIRRIGFVESGFHGDHIDKKNGVCLPVVAS